MGYNIENLVRNIARKNVKYAAGRFLALQSSLLLPILFIISNYFLLRPISINYSEPNWVLDVRLQIIVLLEINQAKIFDCSSRLKALSNVLRLQCCESL